MIDATAERALLSRIERLEREVGALFAYIQERTLATEPATSWSGSTAAEALRRLDEVASTKHEGVIP